MNKWMMMGRVLALGFFAPVSLAAEEAKGEKIDNPEYTKWAAFKAGAMCKTKTVSVYKTPNGQTTSETTMIITVKEVTAEKIVLETVMISNAGGKEMKIPLPARDVPAKVNKPKVDKTAKKPEVTTTEGEEEITVPAGTFKCKTSETTMKVDGKTIVTKVWICKTVVGWTVKMTSETTGGGKTTSELVEQKAGA